VTDEPDSEIICATYTHARRHPLVVGQIGGWTPPFQLTLPQLAILVVGYWVEAQTWHLWIGRLPGLMGIGVAVCLPILLGWGARRARIEGRSLPRAVVGWMRYLWSPRGGAVGGRPSRPSRHVALGTVVAYVEAGAEEG
jgi:uncharacterized membrane protein YedE/YeeE